MGGNLPVKTDMRSTLVSLCLIFKLAGGKRLVEPFADGKYTGDSRFSGARGCSHLDGTK